MKATQENIVEVINNLQKNNQEISWPQIVAAVKAVGITVKNWMLVRGILQWFINEGKLTRTADVNVEVYTCNH